MRSIIFLSSEEGLEPRQGASICRIFLLWMRIKRYNAYIMTKLRVGVLRGGPSDEYDVSLNTGANVLRALSPQVHVPHDIFIDKEGTWHINGYPASHEKVAKVVDVVFNGLHGTYGEDGTVQRELDRFGVVYTGSKAFPSALAMNKPLAKQHFEEVGMRTPRGAVVREDDDIGMRAMHIFQSMPLPYVVKPAACGSSVGVSIVYSFENLMQAIEYALSFSSRALIEEFIKGREITCAVVEGVGGQVYALAPIEVIVADKNKLFDYEAKYSGTTQEICPAHISPDATVMIQDLAVRAHKALGLRHYSRTDFMVTPKNAYALETNSLPGLSSESLVPKALKAGKLPFEEFVGHVLELALRQK